MDIHSFFLGVAESIIAAILILIIIKVKSLSMIWKFRGDYIELFVTPEEHQLNYNYHVEYLPSSFFDLSPFMAIKITRKNTGDNDNANWEGTFNSDILNPYYFKGIYFLEDRDRAEIAEIDNDGWFEIYLLNVPNTEKIRIAMKWYYINNKNKIDSKQYLIVKKNCTD